MTDNLLPTRKKDWSRLIEELGLRPSKGRGQNFLFEQGVVHRIVKSAGISADDHVLEIGPGLGILTQELLAKANKVSAIEIDPLLSWHLRSVFGTHPGFELFQADAIGFDLAETFGAAPLKVVANLPYSAAAAIIQHLLEANWNMVSATVMVQLEVGERMLASPPNMSILSVATQVYAVGEEDFIVPPDVFIPSPAIDSLVLTLRPHTEPLLATDQRKPFFHLVNSGFRHRRKNIANSLDDETPIGKSDIARLLGQISIDPMRRAQTLSVDEWLLLNQSWPWHPAVDPR